MSKGIEMSYDEANEIAISLLVKLGMLETTDKIAIVGSLRRKAEAVNDIDYQVIGDNFLIRRELMKEGFHHMSGKDKREIYVNPEGVYVNIFYTFPEYWGSSLMHNTGPSKYNIRKRYMVKKQGYLLNQYGLYKTSEKNSSWRDSEWIAGKTEQSIYDALGWEYCKPEDRI